MPHRCPWAKTSLDIIYHDTEWGVPVHDDQLLFELLCLEGAQAGLSWSTILAKRENYRLLFDNFDAEKIAAYDQNKIDELLQNPGIIRNRLKVQAFITNARAYLKVKQEFGSFNTFIWQFVNHTPIHNHWHEASEVPTKTEISDKMSKELLKRGFKFTGSTICYAYMQAIGMVNDHLIDCFRYSEV
jgi:DNA-3-methyladenine glycosylase I